MIAYNTLIVLLGTALLGLVSGVIGSYTVLRRRALMGDALAHAALPGICMAYLALGERHLAWFLVGALISGTLGVLVVSLLRHATRIKEDAAIGIVLSVFFGGGIVLLRLIQNQPGGNRAGLDSYIYGKAASMVLSDVWIIAAVSVVVVAATLLLGKEFKIISFDREFAAAQGWPTLSLDIMMMALLVAVTVMGLPAVGVVMMAALLIVPGASARFWTERLETMLLLAAAFGALTGAVGTFFSAEFARLPAGPVIVLVGAAIFVVSMTCAPRRGVLSRIVSRLRMQRVTSRQNLLRTLYELSEPQPESRPPCDVSVLAQRRAWSPRGVRRLLCWAHRENLIEQPDANRVRLTASGLEHAADVVRTHRLWEMFLIDEARIATDHVDRDADSIEHVLGPRLVRRLEQRLVECGRLPKGLRIPPPSPHALPETDAKGPPTRT